MTAALNRFAMGAAHRGTTTAASSAARGDSPPARWRPRDSHRTRSPSPSQRPRASSEPRSAPTGPGAVLGILARVNAQIDEVCAAVTRSEPELLPLLSGGSRSTRSPTTSRAWPAWRGARGDFAGWGSTLERRRADGHGDHLRLAHAGLGRAGRPARGAGRPPRHRVPARHLRGIARRDGDRLRGPGVLDMKGGLLVARTALAALAGRRRCWPSCRWRWCRWRRGDRLAQTHAICSRSWLAARRRRWCFEAGPRQRFHRHPAQGHRQPGRGHRARPRRPRRQLPRRGRQRDLGAGPASSTAAQRLDRLRRAASPSTSAPSAAASAKNTVPAEPSARVDFRFVTARRRPRAGRDLDRAAPRRRPSRAGARFEHRRRGASACRSSAPTRPRRSTSCYAACARAGRPGRRRAPLHRRRLRRQHRRRGRRSGHRRAGPARARLPHPRRAHRGRHPGAPRPGAGGDAHRPDGVSEAVTQDHQQLVLPPPRRRC